ncbi:MAG: diacylglycerol kinase family protein [Candidatus Omnitrophota bacterium]|nr:diacylglycerol kinase family protein [Candidatus Omnitrophota bacterium]
MSDAPYKPHVPSRNFRDSFLNAITGLGEIFKTQRNARIILAAAIAVVILGFLFRLAVSEMAILLLTIGLVFVSEVFNTMTEEILDIISPHYNHKARLIKDIAAGAVLVSCLISLIVGALIFLKRLP